MERITVIAAVFCLAMVSTQAAKGGPIPYPNSGSYNPTTYTFTATNTGPITAYFVGGGGAGYSNDIGLLVNGVPTGVFGLNNHNSNVGQSLVLGMANAGDTLTFILENLTLGMDAYSDPSLNVSYDTPGETLGHNHVYSTTYTASGGNQLIFSGVPVGTYVAFEDLPFPSSDFNYNDESFVFTNVGVSNSSSLPVPEPNTLVILGLSVATLTGQTWWRRKRTAV